MEIQKLNCASCGAPLDITDKMDLLKCPFCNAQLSVNRGEGYTTLKLAEQVSQAVEKSGSATQSTIRDSTQVTQGELKRLEISQDLAMLQMQLTNIQSEIRSLERGKSNNVIFRQINDLRIEEMSIRQRIQVLQTALMPVELLHQKTDSRQESLGQQEVPSISRSGPVNVKPRERQTLSGWLPIIIGSSLFICGVLIFCFFIIAQIGSKEGATSNLVGFIGALLLCPTPIIIFGIIMLIIGFVLIVRSRKTKI